MLPVARRIAPPCIVGDDGHGTGSLADIICVIFSINGFVAYCGSYRNFSSVKGTDMKQTYLILSDASSHYSAEHVIDAAEYCRIRSVLDRHDKLALMEDLGP